MRKMDINVGDKFGDWTVTNINVPSKNKSRYVLCQCKCGYMGEVNASALRTGRSSSCKSCAKRKNTTILKVGSKYKHWTILEVQYTKILLLITKLDVIVGLKPISYL